MAKRKPLNIRLIITGLIIAAFSLMQWVSYDDEKIDNLGRGPRFLWLPIMILVAALVLMVNEAVLAKKKSTRIWLVLGVIVFAVYGFLFLVSESISELP